MNRRPLPAVALTTDTSVITALANDFGYDTCFARQVEALADRGDVILAFSTSGNSKGIVDAVLVARDRGGNFHWIYRKGRRPLRQCRRYLPENSINQYTSNTGMSHHRWAYCVLDCRKRTFWGSK